MFDDEKDVNDAGSSTAETVDTATGTPADDGGKTAESLNTDATPASKTPDVVPYNRFSEVVNEKNEATRLLKEYEARIRDYEQKQTVTLPAQGKPKFNDPNTQAFYDQAIAPLESELKQTKAQWQAEQQAGQIMKEIDGLVSSSYGKADKEWVVNTLIGNPKAKIAELVKYSHDKEVARDKAIIDTYLKGKQEEAKHKAKSPAGSAPAAKAPDVKGKGWSQQLKGANETFLKRLQAEND